MRWWSMRRWSKPWWMLWWVRRGPRRLGRIAAPPGIRRVAATPGIPGVKLPHLRGDERGRVAHAVADPLKNAPGLVLRKIPQHARGDEVKSKRFDLLSKWRSVSSRALQGVIGHGHDKRRWVAYAAVDLVKDPQRTVWRKLAQRPRGAVVQTQMHDGRLHTLLARSVDELRDPLQGPAAAPWPLGVAKVASRPRAGMAPAALLRPIVRIIGIAPAPLVRPIVRIIGLGEPLLAAVLLNRFLVRFPLTVLIFILLLVLAEPLPLVLLVPEPAPLAVGVAAPLLLLGLEGLPILPELGNR
mmetsp:Transcript_108955/g.307054  ORF Transcript_108955/g.307054 Transcript_108955/m.307054 type:complete len:298 (+) Transcript_108955:431-1324(+)